MPDQQRSLPDCVCGHAEKSHLGNSACAFKECYCYEYKPIGAVERKSQSSNSDSLDDDAVRLVQEVADDMAGMDLLVNGSNRQDKLPAIPQGYVCLCNVPPGCAHSDVCYKTYIWPKLEMQQRKDKRIRDARHAIVEAAEAMIDWPEVDAQVPYEALASAVDAYRESLQ